jgi:hypothetical protein
VAGSAAGLLGRSLNQYMPIQKLNGAAAGVWRRRWAFRWLVNFIEQRVDLQQNPARRH